MIKCLRKKKKKKTQLTKYWLLTRYTRAYDYKFLSVWRSKEFNQAYNGDGVTIFVIRSLIWVHLQWDLLYWHWLWLPYDSTIEKEQSILIAIERNMPPSEHSLESILSIVVLSVWFLLHIMTRFVSFFSSVVSFALVIFFSPLFLLMTPL